MTDRKVWFITGTGSGMGVDFGEPARGVRAAIGAAYHSKYDRCGPRIVGSVVGPGAEAVTIKLVS